MSEQLGRYTLERKLAVGGMAEVFLARQSGPEGFEKVCVVKRMLPSLADDENFVRMFLQEARLAAQLNHPNIAQIYDFGAVNETFYLAMEYVQGSNLRTIVKQFAKRGSCVPVSVAARIASHAALALDYAHNATTPDGEALGIIHRDVSPQNILIGKAGTVKLIDFGVAKATTATHHTKTGLIKGKYAYMSPEQLRAQPLDARSDLFALGLVLYELLAPGRAIKGTSDLELMENAIKMNFEPLDTLRPDLPSGLRSIVRKSLMRDRDARYPSAHEMSDALEMFIAQQGEVITGADLQRLLDDKPGAGALGEMRLVSSNKHPVREDPPAPISVIPASTSSTGDGDGPVSGSTTAPPAPSALALYQEPTRNQGPSSRGLALYQDETRHQSSPRRRRRSHRSRDDSPGTDPYVGAAGSAHPTGPGRAGRSFTGNIIYARPRLAVMVGFAFGLSVVLGGVLRGCLEPSPLESAGGTGPIAAPALSRRTVVSPTPVPALLPKQPEARALPAVPPAPVPPAAAPSVPDASVAVAAAPPKQEPIAPPPPPPPPRDPPQELAKEAVPPPKDPPPVVAAKEPPPRVSVKPPKLKRRKERVFADLRPQESQKTDARAEDPRPAPPPPPPPKTQGSGRAGAITFLSLPPTDVVVDGAPRGRSPVTVELPVGEHQVVFQDERSNLRHQESFNVAPGEARRVEWRATTKGRVIIRAIPYADVVLGDKPIGMTPLPPMELPEGLHKFVFSNKDTGKTDVRTVKVTAGQDEIVKVDLRAEQ